MTGYSTGDILTVRMNVEVTSEIGSCVNATTEVTEISGAGAGCKHYIYLTMPVVKGQEFTLDFEARVIVVDKMLMQVVDKMLMQPGCVAVTITTPDAGFTHYLDPESPSVTRKNADADQRAVLRGRLRTELARSAGVPADNAADSNELIVKMRVVVDDTIGTYANSTTKVTEISGRGRGTSHYLYLGSPAVCKALGITGLREGLKLSLSFTARISNSEFPGPEAKACTPVSITGLYDFTHYLNLDSPSITRKGDTRKAAEMTNNEASIIDSRDIDQRIVELEAEDLPFKVKMPGSGMPVLESFASFDEALEYRQSRPDAPSLIVTEIEDEDIREELQILREFRDEAGGPDGEWQYGITLIRDSYFDGEFAKEQAEDLGLLRAGSEDWPYAYIDWDEASDALRQDYASAEFDGVTYFYRP